MTAGQPSKAPAPILVTPSLIVMLVRLLQLAKARSPMLVTLSGIVMLVRLAQFSKAARPIPVTGLPSMVSGMTSIPEAEVSQSVMVTSLPVVVHVSCPGLLTSIVNPFQVAPISPKPARKPFGTMTTAPAAVLSKMFCPRVAGTGPVNVILARLVQSRKALVPTLVTLSGSVTLVRLLQRRKAFLPIPVTPLGIVTVARLLHSVKVLSPIEVTLLGIVTPVRLLHSLKA